MGRRTDKNKAIDTTSVRQLLGRIFLPRHMNEGCENALPFLLIKERAVRVELARIIDVISKHPDLDDHQIVGMVGVHGVRPADIEIVRAYIHRFGTDVANPLPIDAHPTRALLLDENTPQPAMLHLSKSFGWTTHVATEGLAGRGTPDQDIWEFAYRKKFAAIVTRDTDFLDIQEYLAQEEMDKGANDIPLLIFVPETLSTESLCELFAKHGRDIRRHMTAKSHLVYNLGTDIGFQPRF